MDNGAYVGLGTLVVIFLIGWLIFRKKCRREGKFYGKQQIRNPEELGDGTDTRRDSCKANGRDSGDTRGEPGVNEYEGGEQVLGESIGRNETVEGDGEHSNLPAESISNTINNKPAVESDSITTELSEQDDGEGEQDEEEIPEVDSL